MLGRRDTRCHPILCIGGKECVQAGVVNFTLPTGVVEALGMSDVFFLYGCEMIPQIGVQ